MVITQESRSRGVEARVRRLLVVVAIPWALAGCGARAEPSPASPPQPIEIAAPRAYAADEKTEEKPSEGLSDICKIDPSACPKVDMAAAAARPLKSEIYAVQQIYGGVADLSSSPPPPPVAPSAIEINATSKPNADKIDVVARVEIEVARIARAVSEVRALVAANGGQVVNEVVEAQAATEGAALSLQIPAKRLDQVLSALAGVGTIRSRKIEAQDIGRETRDAEILEKNLEVALHRYEELMKQAANVNEMIAIEAALARVRTDLERVRADQRSLGDRAARSTLYVTLAAAEHEGPPSPAEARLHPGARASFLFDVDGGGGAGRRFGGPGLSIQIARWFSFDMDLLTGLPDPRGLDAFLLTGGSELYSDFMGGGKRETFNPYLGIRAGYARVMGENALAVGGSLGLELYKGRFLLLEVETRGYALPGFTSGVHAGIQPALAANVSY